jgi:hypothetical protein
MYYVLQVRQGRVSHQSNLVAFPLLTPPVTFAQLLNEIERWNQRGRFANATLREELRQRILHSKALAAMCQLSQAIKTLNPQLSSNVLPEPEATDLEILLSKLQRRLQLYQEIPVDLTSSEFCTFQ